MKKIVTFILGLLFIGVLIACNDDNSTQKFVVSFETNGGTPSIPSQEIEAGLLIIEPSSILKEGYEFGGWYKDDKFETKWDFKIDKVDSNMTLFTKRDEVEKVTISFDTKGGSVIGDMKVNKGSLFSSPTPPTKEGYEFSGWYKDETYSKSWSFTFDKPNKDIQLIARWKQVSDYTKSLKILSIENSFSEDAHRYLYNIATSYGVDQCKVVIANMYIGGAELIQHVQNANSNAKVHQYQLYKGTNMIATNSMSLGEAIAKEYWDVITFQQASHHSGLVSTYAEHLTSLIGWVDALAVNPNVKIGWQMTWAYQQTSSHSGFANYVLSQAKMYQMIIDSVNEKVLTNTQVNFVIPSGTAIQNARTSYVQDTLTRDGYHLSDPLGRYIAGLMFFKSITGFNISPETISYRPNGVSEEDQLMSMEAVNNDYIKPFEVTESSYDIPEPEPIEVEGVNYSFTYVKGFWNSNATSISPESDALHKNFAAVMPIAKAFLPVGSEITIEKGYQYRVIFLEKQGDGFKVLHRTDNSQAPYVKIDEAFWENYQYIAFNISEVPTVDISSRLDEVASKLKLYHPEGTGEGHVDIELTYELGEWKMDGNHPIPSTKKFISIPLTIGFFITDDIVRVKEGYRFVVVELIYENGYIVVNISEPLNELVLSETFKEDKEIISFMVFAEDNKDLTEEKLEEIITITSQTIEHEDEDIHFIQGFWADNATSILTEDTLFNKRFIASNVLSKQRFIGASNLVIKEGYQVRVIFLSYDGYGNYKVLKRSDNLKGAVMMDEAFWLDYEYIAFNLSKNPTQDITNDIENVSTKLSIHRFEEPLIPHMDDELTFVSGYWNDRAIQVTPGTDSFSKGFGASNVISLESLKNYSSITIEEGYQVRIIFFDYSFNTYTVLFRTNNLTGTIELTEELLSNYMYIGFNISTITSSDFSNSLETLSSKIKFNI
ncbi:DUF4886 domain-containing protein [Acholeplasma hippikon]|uniref:Internalin-A n=1 Tax=Acholeplasma hippikon TaxID=264636 RepID=A0A449BKU0_9MOLU|nr:DUF4886 domain-containing protein [Acholeplasma hippikon]VEU83003.1 Internalin-A precursor [Acholeplasma hippikon]